MSLLINVPSSSVPVNFAGHFSNQPLLINLVSAKDRISKGIILGNFIKFR